MKLKLKKIERKLRDILYMLNNSGIASKDGRAQIPTRAIRELTQVKNEVKALREELENETVSEIQRPVSPLRS